MSAIQVPESQPTLTQVFDGLTEQRRREILAILATESTSLSEAALARRLAGDDKDEHDDEIATIRSALRHVHLPKLAALDLADWDRSAETVALGDHPVYDDPRFQRLLRDGDDAWNRAVAVHSDDDCRATVEALSATGGPTSRSELARSLAASEAMDGGSPTAPDDVAVSLHHRHLPKLDDAGLLAYDADDGTVVPADDVDVPLLDATAVGT